MKKKIFSILLTVTMLVSMLSFFSLSAGADNILMEIDGFITMPGHEFYHEEILSNLTVGESYNYALTIPHNGWVIIQTFGDPMEYSFEAKLYTFGEDGWEIECQSALGFKNLGYGYQTLLQFQNGSGSGYVLNIVPCTTEDIRISITVADNYFDREPPIPRFENITYVDGYGMEGLGALLETYWTPFSPAVVGLFRATESGTYSVSTSGSDVMKCYIIDPSSTEIYDLCSIQGSGVTEYSLSAGTIYYLVMYIPVGMEEHPDCFLTLAIDYIGTTL